MADVTSIYGNPIKDAVARADISTLQTDVQDVKDGFDDLDDRVTALEQGGSGSGLTDDIKQALLQIAEKIAYIDEDGQDYYDALEDALYPPADLVSISAVYTQSGTVYDTDSLDSLKSDLVVTAHYSDQTTETVTTYTLSGTLTVGTSTITVTYGGKTTTFNVTVTQGVIDTTASVAESGKLTTYVSSEVQTRNYANGGITIKYQMDAPSTALYPAGIIPISSSDTIRKNIGILTAYDSSGNHVNHVSEMNSDTPDRWAQRVGGTLTEFFQQWTIGEYTQIEFCVDINYLDDAYMYDKATGQVWFAGINTPYYGMRNISEAGA